jgi:YVTN family beta-propeller protein
VSDVEIGSAPGFEVMDEIAVRRGAVSGMAVSPDGTRLLVTHYGDGSVSVIDTRGNAVAQTVVDIDEPFAIAMSGTRAYVSTASSAYDAILAFDINASRVVADHPMTYSVTDLAVSPDGRRVYASRTAADGADVAILDTQTGGQQAIGIATATGTAAECLRLSPDGCRLYVAANGPDAAQLVVIDTRQGRVHNTVEIGSAIRGIALSPDGSIAYVGSCGADYGAVLDVVETQTGAVVSTCKIGEIVGNLTQLALSRDGERAYFVGDTSVTVWSTSAHDVVGGIALGAEPSCVAESADGSQLYIADYAGVITILTTASTGELTPDEVPTAPHQWAFSDLLGREPTPAR